MRYYFVVNALPPLVLGSKPQMSYEEVRQMLMLNLTPEDWKQVVLFQRLMDVRNLRAHWLGQPLDPRGNFGEKKLEEALLVQDFFPPFLSDFLDRYDLKEDRLRYFASLLASVYSETLPELKGFLLRFYQFEREVRLVLTALRAKAMGRDLTRELQFEDPTDPLVAMLLAQKESSDLLLPEEYEDLKMAFLENSSRPKQLQQEILQFRLARIEQMEELEPFGIDQILSYLARLLIIEDWAALDDTQGKAALEGLIQ